MSERDASTPASRFIYSEHGFVLDETEPADLWRIKHPVPGQAHGDLAGSAVQAREAARLVQTATDGTAIERGAVFGSAGEPATPDPGQSPCESA